MIIVIKALTSIEHTVGIRLKQLINPKMQKTVENKNEKNT